MVRSECGPISDVQTIRVQGQGAGKFDCLPLTPNLVLLHWFCCVLITQHDLFMSKCSQVLF